MKRKIILVAILAALSINTVSQTAAVPVKTSVTAGMSEKETLKYIDQLYEAKKYKGAILELEAFLKVYPRSRRTKDIQTRLAKTYFVERDYNNSRKYFDILLVNYRLKRSELEDLNLYQTKNHANLKEYEKAKEYLNLLTKSDKREDAIYALGLAYYNDKRYNEAQKEFNKLLVSKGSKYDQAILYLALSSYNNNQFVKSTIYLDEYYNGDTKDKNYPLMNYIYGSCYMKMEDFSKAEGYFKSVADNYPENVYAARSNLSLITIYRKLKNDEALYTTLDKISTTSEATKAYKIVGEYTLGKNEFDKASKYFSMIPEGERDLSVTYGYAYSLYKEGKIEEALKEFKKLENTNLDSDYIYYTVIINYESKNYQDIYRLNKEISSREIAPKYRESVNEIMANSAYELGEYQVAREYFLKVYEKTYTKESLYRLIVVDSKIGDLEDLEIRFSEYRKTFVKDQEYREDIYLATGVAYEKVGDKVRAEEIYREYLVNNRDYKISKNLVSILLEDKRYKEMEGYLVRQDKTPENTYLRGIAALGMRSYEDATIYFTSILDNEELGERASYNLVKTYSGQEANDKTILAADKYIERSYKDNFDEVVDLKSLAYFRQGDYELSRKGYESLISSEGYEDYALYQVAETYYAEQDYENALDSYIKAYTRAPKSTYAEDARYWEIKILGDTGRVDEAITKIDEFISVYSSSEYKKNLVSLKGDIYREQGKSDEALISYTNLYELATTPKERETAIETLVELNYNKGNIEEASSWISKLEDRDKASYWGAIIMEKNGEVNQAHIEYTKLLEVEEYRDKAAYNLALYYEDKGNTPETKKYYEIVESSNASEFKDVATFKLGAISEDNKEYNEALRRYIRISLLYVDSPLREASIIKSASIYEKMEDILEAINIYDEYVKEYSSSKYTEYSLEKLISLNLQLEKKGDARHYYDKLVVLAPEKSKKYSNFF